MNEKLLIASKLILSHIVLPVCVCAIFFLLHATNFNFLIVFSIAQSLLGMLYFAGYWEFWGFRFRSASIDVVPLLIHHYSLFIFVPCFQLRNSLP